MTENKTNFSSTAIVIMIIISVIAGSIAGGVVGFFTATSYSSDWRDLMDIGKERDREREVSSPHDQSVIAVVEKSIPAVVSIVVTKEITRYYNNAGSFFPFEEFFGFSFPGMDIPQYENREPETQTQRIGAGTGFIISADGLILTNKHVVSDSDAEYSVVTNEGETYPATVLGRDPLNDIAVLKIEAESLPALPLGDSDQILIGETVVAIGYALGEYTNTVTTGIISGLGRDVVAGNRQSSERLQGVIQTDTAINPGNSGGPLINLEGEVIGINTAVNQQGQLIGFAIPVNSAKLAISSVEEHGRIVRPFLGVRYVMITEELAEKNNLSVDEGALIISGQEASQPAIAPGSPADKAGLRENDIILRIYEEELTEKRNLASVISQYEPGNVIRLTIFRRGEEQAIDVTLEEFTQ
ncbi:MAG: trypsin-like peptidase domain-containing protein [Candidatus Komeilibacteria bacterium]|nr:trypsin-like peptidase domain-containing protein [Candidatus Komeilibacteria bacterium]